MSQARHVTYAKHGFWAYDVALGVLVKYLLDVIQECGDANSPWLLEAVASWRVCVVSDFGFTLDENWSADQRRTFVALMEQACAALECRESIPSEEIVSWPFVDDLHISTRGASEVRTAPVVELGRAMIALLRSDLPDAPKGKAWIFGTPEGRSTIRMDASWDGQW